MFGFFSFFFLVDGYGWVGVEDKWRLGSRGVGRFGMEGFL